MEIRSFKKLESQGRATIVRESDDDFRVRVKRFDAETGAEVDPKEFPLTLSGLEAAVAPHEAEIERLQQEIEAHRAEIAALPDMIARMRKLNKAAA